MNLQKKATDGNHCEQQVKKLARLSSLTLVNVNISFDVLLLQKVLVAIKAYPSEMKLGNDTKMKKGLKILTKLLEDLADSICIGSIK